MKDHDIKDNWHTSERILVSISSNPKSKRLIRIGARLSKKYKCELYVAYVDCTHKLSPKNTPNHLISLKDNLLLAEKFNAIIVKLKGRSISSELVKFANENNITKLVIGHSKRTTFQKLIRGSTINKVLENAKNIEIIVIPYNE